MSFKVMRVGILALLTSCLAIITASGQAVVVTPTPPRKAELSQDKKIIKLDRAFTSPDGQFRIKLPDAAEPLSELGRSKKTSDQEDRTFDWTTPKGEILVQITIDLTGILVKNQDAVLNHALDFGIKQSNAKLLSSESIMLGTIRGRKVEVDLDGEKLFARAFVTGDRIYLVVGGAKRGVDGAEKAIQDALDSFLITVQ
jgi:hypothetical protein